MFGFDVGCGFTSWSSISFHSFVNVLHVLTHTGQTACLLDSHFMWTNTVLQVLLGLPSSVQWSLIALIHGSFGSQGVFKLLQISSNAVMVLHTLLSDNTSIRLKLFGFIL